MPADIEYVCQRLIFYSIIETAIGIVYSCGYIAMEMWVRTLIKLCCVSLLKFLVAQFGLKLEFFFVPSQSVRCKWCHVISAE